MLGENDEAENGPRKYVRQLLAVLGMLAGGAMLNQGGFHELTTASLQKLALKELTESVFPTFPVPRGSSLPGARSWMKPLLLVENPARYLSDYVTSLPLAYQ